MSPAKVREAAYASSGLALEFYRSYNVSAHDAAAYFDRISDLKLSHFHPCNTSSNEFANDVEMRFLGIRAGCDSLFLFLGLGPLMPF